jgi:hypothetical protein
MVSQEIQETTTTEIVPAHNFQLPIITAEESVILSSLTKALGVPREIIASDEEIQYAWQNLPRNIGKIPVEYRSPLLARMCIALRVGLFDSAINYAWNTAILSLRNKMSDFGLAVASQLLEKDLTDGKIIEINDSELLKYCLELNLINEDGYYFLSQCRDLRNNYSAAHPSNGDNTIDDSEVTNFISRCAKYAFDRESDPRGVDVKEFLRILKDNRLNSEQEGYWIEKIKQTNDKQRDFIFTTLHGIYCDEASSEQTRLNCLELCKREQNNFTPKVLSNLINQHQDYLAKGQEGKLKASRAYFEKLGFLEYLNEREKHSIVSTAIKNLISAHNAMNNFYNEPPFAERLLEISQQLPIPDSAKSEFVEAVVTCAVGNPWGVCKIALPHYKRMIAGFNQKEIKWMLDLPITNTIVGRRIKEEIKCKNNYIELVGTLSVDSIPASLTTLYNNIIKGRLTYQGK